MREIKFRAMSLDGKWHIGLLGRNDKHGFCISNAAGSPWAFPARPETIGQYTGLKDKNGVEIYEGDVVTLKNKPGQIGSEHMQGTGVVGWYQPELCFGWAKAEDSSPFHILHWGGTGSVEVIGNIYENPELMQEQAI